MELSEPLDNKQEEKFLIDMGDESTRTEPENDDESEDELVVL